MRTSHLLLALIVAAVMPLTIVAQDDPGGLRPVTHEDVWLMRRIGTPVPSPDGNRVVFQVTEPSYEEDGTVSDLWVATVDGNGAPRRLTATPP